MTPTFFDVGKRALELSLDRIKLSRQGNSLVGLLDTFSPGIVISHVRVSGNNVGDDSLPRFARISEKILIFH